MTAVDRGPADVVDEQPGAIAAALAERGRSERTTKLWEDPHGIWGFLSTVDHKRLGMRYIYTAFVFFFIAGTPGVVHADPVDDRRVRRASARRPTTSCSRCTARR